MHQAQAEAEVVGQDRGRPGAGASTGTGTGEPYLLVRTAGEEGAKGRRGTGILRQRDLAADGHDSHEEQQKAQAQQADEQARRPSLFQDPKPRSDRPTG